MNVGFGIKKVGPAKQLVSPDSKHGIPSVFVSAV